VNYIHTTSSFELSVLVVGLGLKRKPGEGVSGTVINL